MMIKRPATCTHRRVCQAPPLQQLKSARRLSIPCSATESTSYPSRSKLWGHLALPRVASFLTWRLASALEPARKASARDLIASLLRLSKRERPHACSRHMEGRPSRRAHNQFDTHSSSLTSLPHSLILTLSLTHMMKNKDFTKVLKNTGVYNSPLAVKGLHPWQ